MSKILTGENLKFIATHREEIELYHGGIYFCFDSKANGAEAYNILSNRLSSDISRISYGLDKRDFTIIFKGGETKAAEIYPKIVKEIEDYRQVHPEVTDPYYTDPNDPDLQPGSSSGTGSILNSVSKSTDWTTYLIIGAAVVAVIMLLWDRKKKK